MTNKQYWAIRNDDEYLYLKYLTESGSGFILIKVMYLHLIGKKFIRRYKNCYIIKKCFMQYIDGILYIQHCKEFKEGYLNDILQSEMDLRLLQINK